MASVPPLSSLRLLVPPLRLLMAAMWQVARQRSVKHYGMLEVFVSLVTEAVPQLLTNRQRKLLLTALRAKVTVCDPDLQSVDGALPDKRHSVTEATANTEDEWPFSLESLRHRLMQSPEDRHRLLLEVFNPSFDSALQSLICDFLSRIEQLFPVPDFKQAACWLDAAPCGLDDCLQDADSGDLKELLANQSCLLGRATTTVSHVTEKILLSTWSHPLLTKLANPDGDAAVQSDPAPSQPVMVEEEVMKDNEREHEDFDVEVELEETVIGQNLSEATNESSAAGQDDVAPAMVGTDRFKDSPADLVDQSENRVDQSDQTCSEVTVTLCSISQDCHRLAHKCPGCGKCFIYRSQVIRHLRTNRSCASTLNQQSLPVGKEEEPRPSKTHSCFQCSATFRAEADLLVHQRSHRPRQPMYQCSQCDNQFRHLSSLNNHKQTHLDREVFTCSKCDKVFVSAEERDFHLLQHRLPDLSCSVCQQMFSSQTLLLRHLQTHSVEGAQLCYKCRYCDQSFSGVTLLRIHQRSHNFRSHRCDQCSKSYSSLSSLNSHRASHLAGSRYLCPQCGKCFKTREGLENHLRMHSGERPFRCPYCPKDFTAVAGLNVHVRRHTGERPYVCTVCGKGWPSGGDLQKHMRVHTGERPYVCQDCGKAFAISCHLTEHLRVHTGEKPFQCPECGKCLKRKFDLKKHMLVHSGIRPFTCVHCLKSYTRKTHLSRHLKTHRSTEAEEAAEA